MPKNTCETCKHCTASSRDEPCLSCVDDNHWAAREDATDEVSAKSGSVYGWCCECGPRRADGLSEDGECSSCGNGAMGPGAEQAIKLTHTVETLERVATSRPPDRVWLAGMAMQSCLSILAPTYRAQADGYDITAHEAAEMAVCAADALLAELEKKR
jgi:hypothetical protein